MPIDAAGSLTITPEDIQITRHLFDAFGQYETEISASWLVRFAQDRGTGWTPFTEEDIEKFYSKGGKFSGFTFNKLISGGWIREAQKGHVEGSVYYFTEEFISRCYKSASRPCGAGA